MTKNDKTPATGVEQRTPSSSKKATTITDHFKASGAKKGPTKPEKSTKTPPVPVTNDKNTAKNNTGSPTVAKDLQEQFNNDPMQKRSSEQDDSISVNSQNSKKSYATAVKGDTSTEKEDFLTSDGFTLLQKDKRKRNKIASPSKSLASPTQKQSKLFLLGNSPYRHSKDNDKIQATPETEQPETFAQPNPDQDTFKPQPTMQNQVKPTAPPDLNHKKNNVGFAADMTNAIDKKKPLTHAYLSMLKVDMESKPFSTEDIIKPALAKIHHLFKESDAYRDIVGDMRSATRSTRAEFCSECLKSRSVCHDEEKTKRGTNLIKRTLRRLVKNKLEDFPNWDQDTQAFSDTPNDMEKLMISMMDVFGPVPLVTEEEEEGLEEAEETNQKPSPPTAPPKAPPKVANPYTRNPPNKSKKAPPKKKKVPLTPLYLKVKPPPHDSWGEKDNTARNAVYKELMAKLMEQITTADPEARLEPYETPFTRARNKPQQRSLNIHSKGLPSNPYMCGWYWGYGFLYSSGNQSQFQILVMISIEHDAFVEKFNAHGQDTEEDEIDAFQVEKHPIQNGDTTCVAILPGTTANTDCEYLQQELQAAINNYLLITDPEKFKHIYCQFLNIQLNQQERIDIRNEIKQYEYIPAMHIFGATEDYKDLLAALSYIYDRKRKTNFPTGVKYACVPASDTKGYRGNRDEIEAINEALKEEQRAFLADLETERVSNMIRGDPNKPFDSRMPTITLASLIRSFRTRSKGPSLFVGFDRDIYRPGSYIFTFRKHDKTEAITLIDGMGISLTLRLGTAVWKAFTIPARHAQENSYKHDDEQGRFSTQEERTVLKSWSHDIFKGRAKSKYQQQISCPIKHSIFECQGINAFKDATILNVYQSLHGSQGTATNIPPDWDLQSYFNSVNSAVAWDTIENDEVDLDDLSSATETASNMETESNEEQEPQESQLPTIINVPKPSPPPPTTDARRTNRRDP